MDVTKHYCPATFKALQEIDYANGRQPYSRYRIPDDWASRLAECESSLACLTAEEMETLCDGEEGEVLSMLVERPGLQAVDDLLNAHFEEEWGESQ
jgi:hypothetical protein